MSQQRNIIEVIDAVLALIPETGNSQMRHGLIVLRMRCPFTSPGGMAFLWHAGDEIIFDGIGQYIDRCIYWERAVVETWTGVAK